MDSADLAAAEAELERAFTAGRLRGWKVPLGGQKARDPQFGIDSPRMDRLLAVCRKHGAFVQIHGDTTPEFVTAMTAAAGRSPDLTFVLAHMGFPTRPGWVERIRLARLPNVYHDTAGIGYVVGQRYPWPKAQEAVRVAVEEVGDEKVLWATDYPRLLTRATYQQEIDFIAEDCAFLSAEQKARILGGNAARVLGLG